MARPSHKYTLRRERLEVHTKTRKLGHRVRLRFSNESPLEEVSEDRIMDLHEFYEFPPERQAVAWAATPSKMFSWRIRIDDTDFGEYEGRSHVIDAVPKCLRRLRMIRKELPQEGLARESLRLRVKPKRKLLRTRE